MEGEFTVKLLRKIEAAEYANKGRESLKDKIWKENKKMWVVAAPAIFTRFTTFGTGVISQAFIGHIGRKSWPPSPSSPPSF
ncbi:UNVERIFIED_CONTAM: protein DETOXIFICATION 21 [Sesamum calycinum]|uniref:Protein DETOXIFICATION 21 n=1 Tax=Sesamum calycinum TaxID=2727403 RepID=A0AAW2IYL6_9LAMI